MVVRLYVYAIIVPIDGVDRTFYEAKVATHHASYAEGESPSELAKKLQKAFQNHEVFPELQHDKEDGGHGAFVVFRQPYHVWITPEGKLSNLSPIGKTRLRALNEEEIKEFLTALQ